MTTDIDRAEVFSRPAARFDEDGQLEIRASSALGCRRALWYAATGYEPANPPSEDSLTAMEAGNALEPVVLRAMERAGWQVSPADPQDPEAVSVRIGPNLLVTGHPDATGRMPLDGEEADSEVQAFLFGGGPAAPHYGGEMVVEVKTRGPEAFKTLAHPGSGAQPPGVGCPSRLLHAGSLRRASGRRHRHDGHGRQNVGLRNHPRRPAGAGLAGRLRVAGTARRSPRPERA